MQSERVNTDHRCWPLLLQLDWPVDEVTNSKFSCGSAGKSYDGTTVEPGAIKSVIRKMLGGRQSLTYKHRAAVQGLSWPLIVWVDRGKRRHLFLRDRYRHLEYEPIDTFGARRSRQRAGKSEIATVSR